MAATEKNETQLALARKLKNTCWCDDYERMISGMLYDPLAPELERAKFKARAFSNKYNTWFPHDDPDASFETLAAQRHTMLTGILGAVGPDAYIEPPFTIDYGCNIRLGDRFYANFNLCVLDCGLVTVGDRAMIGPNVSLFAATHEAEVQSRRDNVEYTRPIVIGDDCWIGGHVVILPGVTIGDGVTIGAGSVVTKDIPSWSVAVGSPARVVKKVTELERLDDVRKVDFVAMERAG